MSPQTTCEDFANITSLQALVSGPLPCGLQAGTVFAISGPHLALANLSAKQAREQGLLMSGICGPRSTTSSASADLQECLENRLRVTVQALGSTLYKTTWKQWSTSSQRSRLRQRASGLSIVESERTGLPTPGSSVVDAKPRPPIIGNRKPSDPQIGLADIAVWLIWPAQLQTGCFAPTEGRARLNPDYARWLMNIPAAWSSCAPTATRLTSGKLKLSLRP